MSYEYISEAEPLSREEIHELAAQLKVRGFDVTPMGAFILVRPQLPSRSAFREARLYVDTTPLVIQFDTATPKQRQHALDLITRALEAAGRDCSFEEE